MSPPIGLKAALNGLRHYPFKQPDTIVDHLVIGAGVTGLAIARLLSKQFPEKTTYLVERNPRAGEETSSRNSEVIHAGLYYPVDSLKANLCIRGRELLYDYCLTEHVPFRKTGKLVVALPHQRDYLHSLHAKASSMQGPTKYRSNHPADEPEINPAVPTQLITGDEARQLEPNLSLDIVAALLSHETGILDSHSLMASLEKDILDSESGEIVYSTSVVRVDPDPTAEGWIVQTVTGDPHASGVDTNSPPASDALLTRRLISASGLAGNLILNSLLPLQERIPMYFARGSYATYKGPGVSNVSRLIYPCPDAGKTGHAFQSLGTHLTIDMDGNVRFGPDLQWISPDGGGKDTRTISHPTALPSRIDEFLANDANGQETENMKQSKEFSYDEREVDFWKRYLVPDESQLDAMCAAVKTYLPGVDRARFRPAYVGIRPKLVPPAGGFSDFVIRTDHASTFLSKAKPQIQQSDTTPQMQDGSEQRGSGDASKSGTMISLLGIESPGLTSCLAIAEEVVDRLYGNS